MGVWLVLATAIYPMTGNMTLHALMVTLPYWSPILSFSCMLIMTWDLERRLLSVAKLVEEDVEWANEHMVNSYFLKDFVAEAAFEHVHKRLKRTEPMPQIS